MDVEQMDKLLRSIDIKPMCVQAVMETQEEAIALNQSQLKDGLLSTSKPIKFIGKAYYPYSAPWTKQRTKKGLQTDHVDLNYSGGFWQSITLREINDDADLYSPLTLAEYLQKNYSSSIFGLAEGNADAYGKGVAGKAFEKIFTVTTGLPFGK
jgi:hypothetical protein